jgi:hypothetical protein
VVLELPHTIPKDETGKMELTEFQRVPPSPFAISICDDGINPFWVVLAKTFLTCKISVSNERDADAILFTVKYLI